MHNLSYLLFFCHSFIQTRKMRTKSTLFNPWIRNMDTERNKLIMDVFVGNTSPDFYISDFGSNKDGRR